MRLWNSILLPAGKPTSMQLRMRGHEWVGVRRGGKRDVLLGPPQWELSKQDKIKRFRDFLINDGLSNGFELNKDRVRPVCFPLDGMEAQMSVWVSFYFCIDGFHVPGTWGIDLGGLKDRGLHVIITTSEMLSDVDRDLDQPGIWSAGV